MNSILGWALAVAAVAVAYVQWGWQGVIFGLTLVAFWLMLQFSRSLRVLRRAGQAPVGHVASAVMLHSKLRTGMRLMEILPLTGSLGLTLSEAAGNTPETYAWTDSGGDRVEVELRGGRLAAWQLQRATPSDEGAN
jgi:phosphatidylglycerophosphate synthase